VLGFLVSGRTPGRMERSPRRSGAARQWRPCPSCGAGCGHLSFERGDRGLSTGGRRHEGRPTKRRTLRVPRDGRCGGPSLRRAVRKVVQLEVKD